MYSWKSFMLANQIAELLWNGLMGIIMFLCWYYPIGFARNAEATDAVTERSGLMFLLVLGVELAEAAGNIASLVFSLCLIFCGAFAPN
ncbi:hypothetical protein MPER_01863 [Moniliophthora perniciosa FA553]|nr:hypothetical protein MPER_01863 [Moniliophthora perniciosa FA553]